VHPILVSAMLCLGLPDLGGCFHTSLELVRAHVPVPDTNHYSTNGKCWKTWELKHPMANLRDGFLWRFMSFVNATWPHPVGVRRVNVIEF
jgi:hypothetical protein